MSEIPKLITDLYKNCETDDRNHNLKVAALMTGAVFAILNKLANKQDCVALIMRGMKEVGWIEEN